MFKIMLYCVFIFHLRLCTCVQKCILVATCCQRGYSEDQNIVRCVSKLNYFIKILFADMDVYVNRAADNLYSDPVYTNADENVSSDKLTGKVEPFTSKFSFSIAHAFDFDQLM